MNNRLFIGQLSYSVDSESLQDFFMSAGQVTSARVMTHRDSGRSKGYGFVEMASEAEATAAIDQLNGKELMGRAIVVAIARPPEPRSNNGGGGRRFGGGGRDGGGGGYRDRNGGGRDGGGGGYRDRNGGGRDGGYRDRDGGGRGGEGGRDGGRRFGGSNRDRNRDNYED